MKSSEALKLARKGIVRDQRWHVCDALRQIQAHDTDVYRRLRSIFVGTTLEWYLFIRYKSFSDLEVRTPPHEMAELMRQYRLAWIDWMIEGYERVGD